MSTMRGDDVVRSLDDGDLEDTAKLEIIELRRRCLALQQENDALRLALKELERVAQRDTLTPLYNRRHFLASIKKHQMELDAGEVRGAVVFMDVNQLKAINDRYGHAAGDAALVEIAARVNHHIGENEMAARIGGDEFGFILNVMSKTEAELRVEALQQALHASKAEFEDVSIPLSACFGIAMLRGGVSGVSILAEADREMYNSKHRKKLADRFAAAAAAT